MRYKYINKISDKEGWSVRKESESFKNGTKLNKIKIEMNLIINPYVSVGDFVLNEKRETIRKKINMKLNGSEIQVDGNNKYIIDDYNGILAYYNQINERLFYVLILPVSNISLIFDNISLFDLTSEELFKTLQKYDQKMNIEDYVGFGSTKLGIDVYSPNYTDNKDIKCEGISVAIKGYFDVIYKGSPLNVNELQESL
jgi:hypothetical protein